MTYPTHEHSKISFEQLDDTRIQGARYYRNRARGNKASFFMFAITSPLLPYAEYMAHTALINALEGALEIFPFANPLPPLATFSGHSLSVNASRGDKSVTVATTADYKPGDFIQFSNHPKGYQIATKTAGSGVITVGLSCPLLEPVTTSHDVLYGADVVFQMSLNSSFTADIDAQNSKFGVIDVELIEQA
jgi:hypothetical protein